MPDATSPKGVTPIDSTWFLPFPPKRVYDAWVSSDTVIPPATKMDVEPCVGGHYRLTAQSDTMTMSNEGKFLEVEPNRHLLYTWQWAGDEEVTRIDVQFSDHSDGTELRLQHNGFLTEDSRRNHDHGWNSYVAGLIHFIAEQDS